MIFISYHTAHICSDNLFPPVAVLWKFIFLLIYQLSKIFNKTENKETWRTLWCQAKRIMYLNNKNNAINVERSKKNIKGKTCEYKDGVFFCLI